MLGSWTRWISFLVQDERPDGAFLVTTVAEVGPICGDDMWAVTLIRSVVSSFTVHVLRMHPAVDRLV